MQIQSLKSVPTTILSKSKTSISPFCLSDIKENPEIVKKLIALGAEENSKSKGMTAKDYANKLM